MATKRANHRLRYSHHFLRRASYLSKDARIPLGYEASAASPFETPATLATPGLTVGAPTSPTSNLARTVIYDGNLDIWTFKSGPELALRHFIRVPVLSFDGQLAFQLSNTFRRCQPPLPCSPNESAGIRPQATGALRRAVIPVVSAQQAVSVAGQESDHAERIQNPPSCNAKFGQRTVEEAFPSPAREARIHICSR